MWGGTRFAISTGPGVNGVERARILWSLLDRDRSYIRDLRESYVTLYPTRWLYRLRADEGRSAILGMLGIYAGWPLVLLLLFHFGGSLGIPGDLAALLISAAFGFVTLAQGFWQVHDWFGDEEVFAWNDLRLKLLLGLIVGAVWSVGVQALSPLYAIGGLWVFAVSNLIWLQTVVYDRREFERHMEDVGGRLPRNVAVRRLREMAGIPIP